VLSAVFNMLGALVVGTAVANAIAGIVTLAAPASGVAGIGAGVFAATIRNGLTWRRGLPSSSGHALVGGSVGSALAEGGADATGASTSRDARRNSRPLVVIDLAETKSLESQLLVNRSFPGGRVPPQAGTGAGRTDSSRP
jgi:phosphate transporter family protein